MKIDVSLFASSIRPHLWEAFFRSLKGTTVKTEVIFSGNIPMNPIAQPTLNFVPKNIKFLYAMTGDIKPAQGYEVARRGCSGEVVCWVADDCEFPDDVIGKAYRFWKENCSYKDVVCIRTRENYGTWRDCDNTCHHFFSNTQQAPKMAPIGMMSKEYFEELRGIDRRYICGQWDNDLMIRIYNDGGKLFYFGDGCVYIDHMNKHDSDFGISMKRPFGRGYAHDRKILEGSWGRKGQMAYRIPYKRYDLGFEPYIDDQISTKSQSFTLEEVFND